jgi:hypothetical protein
MEKQTEQAVENTASVEDRIGAKFERMFGMSDEPEQPESDEPEGEQTEGDVPEVKAAEEAKSEDGSEDVVEVEFNGQTYQVPKELKDALMATKDYTQKTTEVAQVKRSVELQQQKLALASQEHEFRKSLEGDYKRLALMEEYIPMLKQQTQWDSLTTDQFVRKQKEIQDLVEAHQKLEKTLNGKRAEFDSARQSEFAKLKEQRDAVLSKDIPGWDKHQHEVDSYLKSFGYEAVLPNMSVEDYKLGFKAYMYDKVKAGVKPAIEKASNPVIKPTARNEMPKAVQDKLNYRKAIKKASGTQKKALVEDRIGQIFGA